MESLSVNSAESLKILRTLISGIVSSTSIAWWIWVVYSTLGQLQNNQINFIELLIECFRALLTTVTILTIIAFL